MNKIILSLIIILVVVVGGYFILKGMGGYKYPQTIYPNQQTQQQQQPTPPSQQNQQTNQPTENTVSISIKNFAFDPAALTIKAGTTVVWTNQDSMPHRIQSDKFNSSNLSKGGSFSFKFNDKGTYDYICGIHPSMQGKIIVE